MPKSAVNPAEAKVASQRRLWIPARHCPSPLATPRSLSARKHPIFRGKLRHGNVLRNASFGDGLNKTSHRLRSISVRPEHRSKDRQTVSAVAGAGIRRRGLMMYVYICSMRGRLHPPKGNLTCVAYPRPIVVDRCSHGEQYRTLRCWRERGQLEVYSAVALAARRFGCFCFLFLLPGYIVGHSLHSLAHAAFFSWRLWSLAARC